MSNSNLIADKYPELLHFWSKSNSFALNEISCKSGKRGKWVCSKGHEEEGGIRIKVSQYKKKGSYYCSTCNKMYAHYPEIEKYWSNKNIKDFQDIGLNSECKALFVCEEGHESERCVRYVKEHYIREGAYKCPDCNALGFCLPMIEEIWSKKNAITPYDVSVHSNKKAWFECDKGHHEFKLICSVSKSILRGHSYYCSQCFSFGEKYPKLLKYWSPKNDATPYDIGSKSGAKVWLVCERGHESFRALSTVTNSYDEYQNFYCEYCNTVGFLFPQYIDKWSSKNDKSPFEATPFSRELYWWKCDSGIHDDYLLTGTDKIRRRFNCPECSLTFGEQEIANFLKEYSIAYDVEKVFDECYYELPLRFDFYLPKYNTLIEYDGEQHYRAIDFFGGEESFKKTKIRDKIKNNYCQENDIKLIRIPYWDLDNIEEILLKELIHKGGN